MEQNKSCNEAKTPSVPSVLRAFDLLETIARSKAGLRLSELATQLKLPKSSVHYVALTLERKGYLRRNERSGRYKFGMKLLELADVALTGIVVRDKAAPVLFGLAQNTGLTVHLAVLDRNEAVLAFKAEPPGSDRLSTWLGKRMDMHCTGLGKVFLAHFSRDELSRFLFERGLSRHNEHTIVTVSQLRRDLERTLAQGYALDDEEDELGYRCIACPVFGPGDQVAAAISIAGNVNQITSDNVRELSQKTINAAATISGLLEADEQALSA
jgi:DNA-binding IclR family transcriptional regulator